MVIWPLNNNGEVVVQTIVDPLTPIWFVIVSGVMSASRWDINRASVMEKWSGVSYNPSRGCGGVSVNWDGAVNRGYPQFTQNLPNLAKMTNSPPEEDGRCESLTHFTPSSSKKGASCDGNKNGNKLSHCANYWPLLESWEGPTVAPAPSLWTFSLLIFVTWGWIFSWTHMLDQVGELISMFRCKKSMAQVEAKYIQVYQFLWSMWIGLNLTVK